MSDKVITVFKNGSWKIWTEQDADSVRDEPNWLVNIVLDEGGIDWVSVKERLPEKENYNLSCRVLVFGISGADFKDYTVTCYNYRRKKWECNFKKITYWTKIPAPSEQKCKNPNCFDGRVPVQTEPDGEIDFDRCPDCKGTGIQPASELPKEQQEIQDDVNAKIFHQRLINGLSKQPRQSEPSDVKESHPEDFCQLCGHKNIIWYANNDLWNLVVEPEHNRGIICCPICFVELAEKKGICPTAWRLSQEGDAPEVDLLRIKIAKLGDIVDKLKANLAKRDEAIREWWKLLICWCFLSF